MHILENIKWESAHPSQLIKCAEANVYVSADLQVKHGCTLRIVSPYTKPQQLCDDETEGGNGTIKNNKVQKADQDKKVLFSSAIFFFFFILYFGGSGRSHSFQTEQRKGPVP